MKFFEKLFFENIQYNEKTIGSINKFLTEHNIDLKTFMFKTLHLIFDKMYYFSYSYLGHLD